MKEKILLLAIASCALISFTGCGNKTEDAQAPQSSTSTEDISEENSEGQNTTEEQGTAEEEQQQEEQTEQEQEQEQEQQTVTVYIKYIKVAADSVNIRSGAGTGYAILGTAEKDTLYAYIGETDGWYKIRYLNSAAYISKSYAYEYQMESSENVLIESVIEEGTKLLGTPYVYGAVRCHDGSGNLNKNFTDSKFDCSSLTQYIFYKGANVLLDVTTRTQILQGTTVSKSSLQRGDLLFFTNASRVNNSGIERVGHVALYLGDNLILHTSSDYAKIESISSQRWEYFIQAQRMI